MNEQGEGAVGRGDSLPKVPNPAFKWVRWVVAFGVSVALGLAPFLGLVGIPGFKSLLSLFPRLPFDTTDAVVPLAAFVMGVVAVGVQFYAKRHPEWASLGSAFKKIVITIVAAVLLLLVVHVLTVQQIEVEGEASVSVLLGFSRPSSCTECEPNMSNAECLENTTLSPARILSCWSEGQINAAFLLLSLAYLVLMSTFGVLVGIVVLQEESREPREAAGEGGSGPGAAG